MTTLALGCPKGLGEEFPILLGIPGIPGVNPERKEAGNGIFPIDEGPSFSSSESFSSLVVSCSASMSSSMSSSRVLRW